MTPERALGADSVAGERLTDSLVLWTDHYAVQCAQARNTPVENLLSLYRRPRTVEGRALFTGPASAEGAEGLSFEQVIVLLDRLLAHASARTLDRQVLAAS
ncbi:hypothetical protein ACFWBF_37190 [Streptomyces sp. NPDC060028]|uniref:hypothetical protein n=1 Tax=Streptomyces sp. NPDC060028 TaxID=3347041 RepID=UPI0036C4AD78